jgi:hypothetical protein
VLLAWITWLLLVAAAVVNEEVVAAGQVVSVQALLLL